MPGNRAKSWRVDPKISLRTFCVICTIIRYRLHPNTNSILTSLSGAPTLGLRGGELGSSPVPTGPSLGSVERVPEGLLLVPAGSPLLGELADAGLGGGAWPLPTGRLPDALSAGADDLVMVPPAVAGFWSATGRPVAM